VSCETRTAPDELRRHRGLTPPARLVVGVALLAVCLAAGCGQRAVLGGEDAKQAADALYTAVTSKRPELLRKCEARIEELKSSGKLSEDGFASLKEVITRAHAGEWQPAAERLDQIIRAER
jgi:hypothetical protein